MRIAMIGLGKMGANMTERLLKGGHEVVALRPERGGARRPRRPRAPRRRSSLAELAEKLTPPRAAWVMVPAGHATDNTVEDLAGHFYEGDVIVDGGNSNYKEWQALAATLAQTGVGFVDAGTSGGVWGLTEGYCLMVGGTKESVAVVEPALLTLAPEGGYAHVGPGRRRATSSRWCTTGSSTGSCRPTPRVSRSWARPTSSTSTCTRSPPSGATARWCAAGCSSWPSGRCGPMPASTASRASWSTRARAAGRPRRRSTAASRPRHRHLALHPLRLPGPGLAPAQDARRAAQPVRRPRGDARDRASRAWRPRPRRPRSRRVLTPVDDVPARLSRRGARGLRGAPGAALRARALGGPDGTRRATRRWPTAEGIDWSVVDVYMGDERVVPPDDDDANQRLSPRPSWTGSGRWARSPPCRPRPPSPNASPPTSASWPTS